MMTKLFTLCFVLFCLHAIRARVDDTSTTTPVPKLDSADSINRDPPIKPDANNEITPTERPDKSGSDQGQPSPALQPVASPCVGARAFTKLAYPADATKYIRCRDEFHYDIIPCPRSRQFNEKTKICQTINAVANICDVEKPCLNNAQCIVSSEVTNGFKCFCRKDWTGERCETALNSCVNQPCGEDAECHMLKASDYKQDYVCVCDEQKSYGPNCQETVPNPCTAYSEQFYPFAFSARAYIQCNGELVYMQPCGPSLYWDQDAKICDRKRPTSFKLPTIITKLMTSSKPSETENSAQIQLVPMQNVDESVTKSTHQNELQQQQQPPQRGNLDTDGRFAFVPSRLGNRQQTRTQSNFPTDQSAHNSNFNNQWQSQENPNPQEQQQQVFGNQQWQTNSNIPVNQNRQSLGQGNQWSQSEDFTNQNGQNRQGLSNHHSQQLRVENQPNLPLQTPLSPQRGQQQLPSNTGQSDLEQEIPQQNTQLRFNQQLQALPSRNSQEQTQQIFNQFGQNNQQWHVPKAEQISQTKTQTGGLPQGTAFLQDQPSSGALRQDATIPSSKIIQPWAQGQDVQSWMENLAAETTSTERMQTQILQSNTRFGHNQDREDLLASANKLQKEKQQKLGQNQQLQSKDFSGDQLPLSVQNNPIRQELPTQFGQPQQWQNQKFQSNTEQNKDLMSQPQLTLNSAWTLKNGAQFQGQQDTQDGVNQNQQLQNAPLTDSNIRQGVSNQLRQPTPLPGTSSLQNQQNNGVLRQDPVLQSSQINKPWLQSNLLETTTVESRVRLNVDQLQGTQPLLQQQQQQDTQYSSIRDQQRQARPIQKQQLGFGTQQQQQQNQQLQSDQLTQSTDSNTVLRQDLPTQFGQQSQSLSQPTLRPLTPPIPSQSWQQRQQQPTPSVTQTTYNTEGQLQGGVQQQNIQQQPNYASQNLRDSKQQLDTQQWQSNQFGQKNQAYQGSATQFDQLPPTTGGIRQYQSQPNDGLLRQGPAAQSGWSQNNQKQPIMANAARSILKSTQDINDVAYPGLATLNAPEPLPMQNQPPTTYPSFELSRQSTLNQPQRTAIWQARSQQVQPGGDIGFVVTQKIEK